MLNFSTLFNSKFLPQGLALYFSLKKHCESFRLYVLCVDSKVHEQLRKLNLDNIFLLSLAELETDELKEVKSNRTVAEYCWTLTPQIFTFVKTAFPKIDHLTYLDADLFFYADPQILINDFFNSPARVQITDHHYAPEYEYYAELSGRFCVQFLTFKFDGSNNEILELWQKQCIDWCYARVEDGKYGDQKYLDSWPKIFKEKVFICQEKDKMLAPWNIKFISSKEKKLNPVFYHFHNFRIISPVKALCYRGYKIGSKNHWVYEDYQKALIKAIKLLKKNDIEIAFLPLPYEKFRFFKNFIRRRIKRNTHFLDLNTGGENGF